MTSHHGLEQRRWTFRTVVIILLEEEIGEGVIHSMDSCFRNVYKKKITQLLENAVDCEEVVQDVELEYCRVSHPLTQSRDLFEAFGGDAFIILTDRSTLQRGKEIQKMALEAKNLKNVPVLLSVLAVENHAHKEDTAEVPKRNREDCHGEKNILERRPDNNVGKHDTLKRTWSLSTEQKSRERRKGKPNKSLQHVAVKEEAVKEKDDLISHKQTGSGDEVTLNTPFTDIYTNKMEELALVAESMDRRLLALSEESDKIFKEIQPRSKMEQPVRTSGYVLSKRIRGGIKETFSSLTNKIKNAFSKENVCSLPGQQMTPVSGDVKIGVSSLDEPRTGTAAENGIFQTDDNKRSAPVSSSLLQRYAFPRIMMQKRARETARDAVATRNICLEKMLHRNGGVEEEHAGKKKGVLISNCHPSEVKSNVTRVQTEQCSVCIHVTFGDSEEREAVKLSRKQAKHCDLSTNLLSTCPADDKFFEVENIFNKLCEELGKGNFYISSMRRHTGP